MPSANSLVVKKFALDQAGHDMNVRATNAAQKTDFGPRKYGHLFE